MFRLAKWAYDLGIRHERVRIAAHLQHEVNRAQHGNDRAVDILQANANLKHPSKSAQEKLQFDIAVNNRIQTIINDMFDSSGNWIPAASIMFPDDKHKGEI